MPEFAEAYDNLGTVLQDKGMYDEAIENHQKAVTLKPDHYVAYSNLGNALKEKGLMDEAMVNLRKALSLRPDDIVVRNNLGLVLIGKRQYDDSISCLRKAIEINPGFPDSHNSLGIALSKKDLFDEAIACYKKALSLKPDYVEAYINLGIALDNKDLKDKAIETYKKALSCKNGSDKAYNNLATVLTSKGMIGEAIESYKTALRLQPDNIDSHCYLGLLCLYLKDFEMGWDEYEWRLKKFKVFPLAKPKWAGSCLKGKTILVYWEQGYGDTLQFVRYLPKLTEDYGAKKVLFISNKGLERLLRESDLDAEILDTETPVESLEYDTNIHLLSLARIFKTNLENIPFKGERYLKVNKEKAREYRERYFKCGSAEVRKYGSESDLSVLNIGIFWQGNPESKMCRQRSIPLKHFYPLCKLSGAIVYSLQKGYGIEQLNEVPEGIEITNLGETFNDFSDTAAAIENLDIVITIDTAVAHLSGALGKKTCILLHSYAEWRWHLDMDYSPWYEDVRLFRHKEYGKNDWDEMMERVKEQVMVEVKKKTK